MQQSSRGFELDVTLLCRLPWSQKTNHARHLDIANILIRVPHGRTLVHLGLQITAIRAGVPDKYNREVTDAYLDRLDGQLPPLDRFADVL